MGLSQLNLKSYRSQLRAELNVMLDEPLLCFENIVQAINQSTCEDSNPAHSVTFLTHVRSTLSINGT